MDHVGQKPVEDFKLHVYPEGKSNFKLYEDDVESMDYLQGAGATTAISCDATTGQAKLTIEPRQGGYRGMPAKRAYEVWVHGTQPKQVTVNGVKADWQYDAHSKAAHGTVAEDPSRSKSVVIQCDL